MIAAANCSCIRGTPAIHGGRGSRGLQTVTVNRYSRRPGLANSDRIRSFNPMSHELDPKVGRWYRRLDDEQLFKVVSIDEDEGLVEIKTVDGDIEELDSTEWVELDLEAAEAPEDYVDPDEKSDQDDEELAEAGEEDERPSRGRGSREDWDDDDDDDDDWDDEDDDEDYDADR
jgi:hypothetical protein